MRIWLGLLRHGLTIAGGSLVTNGTLSGDDLSSAAGAISTLVGLVWSIADKRRK